jgi:hypothetical protein
MPDAESVSDRLWSVSQERASLELKVIDRDASMFDRDDLLGKASVPLGACYDQPGERVPFELTLAGGAADKVRGHRHERPLR